MSSPDMTNSLEAELSEARRTISSDGYSISVGELTSMYRDGELIIRPEFQRLFRWSRQQRSRLVESLLLGIPLPSIFVAQDSSGKWELVDGLQRVSTILELQGELRSPEGARLPELVMEGTKYLPSLEGRTWSSPPPQSSLTEAQRLDLKRAKLDVKIIKRESSELAKYDLFQRLNSYGETLTAPELRSALLVAISPPFAAWVEALAADEAFLGCVELSDAQRSERFDLELVMRFLVLHNLAENRLTVQELRDFPQFLDNEAVALATLFADKKELLTRVFTETFSHILHNGADLVFKRWLPEKERFGGSFLTTAFEVFALGVGYHIANGRTPRSDLVVAVKEFWSQPAMRGGFATGKSTERRLSEFVPVGRRVSALAR